MFGLIMDWPLLIPSLARHAARNHGDQEVVSRTVEGAIHRYTYAECYARMQRLAHGLEFLGLRPGERVATLAWNGFRHLELMFAVPGIGAVCHTVNPRLFGEQIVDVLNHADDRYVFTDLTFVPVLEGIAERLRGVEAFVVLTDSAHMPRSRLRNVLCYEELIADRPESYAWPAFDERTAASLCYTSGTTGMPKGVLYSHRSTVLHAFLVCAADGFALSARDAVMPIVPLYHVHGWGIPYAAPMCGAKLVLPGPGLDGASLHELIESERVTFGLGVPTAWLGLLEHLNQGGGRLESLERVIIGGSAAPLAMIETFERRYRVKAIHAWGMTEMHPLGTASNLKGTMERLSAKRRRRIKTAQGRAVYGVELKVVDGDGRELPWDGHSVGELLVRGPCIASGYYEEPEASAEAFTDDGWFKTGDVVSIDPEGFMRIADRAKDVIKSGGEWISSIALETAAMGHPAVAEAAVIGVPHPKWIERPLLLVVPREGVEVSADEIRAFFEGKVAKWWIPDEVVFLEALPHTATGKLDKVKLREMLPHPRRSTG